MWKNNVLLQKDKQGGIMKSFVRNNIRRWLIIARGKFSPPRTEGANRVMRRVILSLPLRDVPSLWNLLLFLLILLAVPACKQPTAPDPKPEFSFTIEDASCTEAWINIKTTSYGSGYSFALNRNDSTVWRFAALPPDTIIVDAGLLPNKEYTYELLAIRSKTAPVSAGKKQVTTMDTTSHNFTWQTWEFGDIGITVLYDVAIIDENNIWAVGEISIRDSSHNGYTTYNAVHWDGVKWDLRRIKMFSSCNPVDYPALRSVYVSDDNKMVLTSGGSIAWIDSEMNIKLDCSIRPLLTGAINKLWGTSSSDLYAVGNSGNIAHWDGVSWKKIESGTDMDLQGIHGDVDGDIWITGISSNPSRTILLSIRDNKVKKIYEGYSNNLIGNEYIGPISGVYSASKHRTYIINWGYMFHYYIDPEMKIKRLTQNFGDVAFSISGPGSNDLYISGQHGLFGHYNGIRYREIAAIRSNNVYFKSVSAIKGTAVCVGFKNYDVLMRTAVIYKITIN